MASAASSAPQELSGRDWANLMTGPAGAIAERVLSTDVAGYLRFRAVCRAWRASSASLRARGATDRRFHPRRWGWIMLPNAFNVRFRRRFLNVRTGERVLLEIPDIHRCYVLGTTTEGLLLVCRTDTYAVQLLNPLTGQIAGLPHASTLVRAADGVDSKVRDLNLRGAGLVGDDDSTVALHFEDFSLAVAKPGGGRWRRLTFQDKILSALPFAGRIYCATAKNVSVVRQTAGKRRSELAVVADHNLDTSDPRKSRLFLVDNDGELLLSYYGPDPDYDEGFPLGQYDPDSDEELPYDQHDSARFMAYRVKLDTDSMVMPLDRLDGQALFIGASCSLVVAAGVSPSARAHTVYFCGHRPKIFALDLLGGSVEPCSFRKGRDAAAYDLSCYSCRP